MLNLLKLFLLHDGYLVTGSVAGHSLSDLVLETEERSRDLDLEQALWSIFPAPLLVLHCVREVERNDRHQIFHNGNGFANPPSPPPPLRKLVDVFISKLENSPLMP